MDLFCFASRTEENIWIGVEQKMWAVATVSFSAMRGRETKAHRYLKIGSFGLLYCNPTHSFTTPFIVESGIHPSKVITDVWPEPWRFPFKISPLGTPKRQVHMDAAKRRWPVLQKSKQSSVSAAMNITGTTVFVPVEITEEDREIILSDLADPGLLAAAKA